MQFVRLFPIAASIIVASLCATAAQAQTTSLLDSYQGSYSNTGAHSGTNSALTTAANQVSFEVFSLANATAITSATLTFQSNGAFQSSTGTQTLTFFDYTGDISSLIGANSGLTGQAVYNDLRSGNSYGAYTITLANGSVMPTFTVTMNQTFINNYNAALANNAAYFAVGQSIDAYGAAWVNSSTTNKTVTLTTTSTVPEPATWGMMILGFGAIGATLRRTRKTTALAA